MKKAFLFVMFVAAVVLTGCKNETDTLAVDGENSVFMVSARSQQAEESDLNVTEFILQIEDLTANTISQMVNNVSAGTSETSFKLKLISGHTYNFLFWADTKGGIYNTEDLKAVSIDPADYKGNNADNDAFYGVVANYVATTVFSQNVTLVRPFAQLNIITTDLASVSDVDVTAGMELSFTAPSMFNVLTDEVSEEKEFTSSTTALYGTTANGKTPVTMDYIFVPADGQTLVDFSYQALGIMSEPRSFTNVPMQRNYRTNLVGDLFTMESEFNVDIDDEWGDGTDTEKNIYVGTAGSLAALKSIMSTEYESMNITLTADINITDANLSVPASAKELVINGNGHKMEGNPVYVGAETVMFSNVVFANATATKQSCVYSIGSTKNLTFDACTFSGHAWDAVQLTNNNIESVTFDKCVFKSTTDYQRYIHLQVSDVNETANVVITNCEFYDVDKAGDSAITIYGFMHSNMTISGNTVYGNGMVNSDMFWISDAFDQTAIFTTAELAGMFAESAIPVAVNSQEELNAAVAAAVAGDAIKIATAGTYKLPNIPANITIKGVTGVVIDALGSGSIASVPNGATFEGLEFNFGATGNYHGFQHAGLITMKNCTLNGLLFSYGDMVFDGCHFVQTAKDYHMWCYGQDVTYKNCVFDGQGKFLNVYCESNTVAYNITFDGCQFNSSVTNKSAINIKETCGSTILKYNVTINNCTTNDNFPTDKVGGSKVWMVDDLAPAGQSEITVTVDGVLKYDKDGLH